MIAEILAINISTDQFIGYYLLLGRVLTIALYLKVLSFGKDHVRSSIYCVFFNIILFLLERPVEKDLLSKFPPRLELS